MYSVWNEIFHESFFWNWNRYHQKGPTSLLKNSASFLHFSIGINHFCHYLSLQQPFIPFVLPQKKWKIQWHRSLHRHHMSQWYIDPHYSVNTQTHTLSCFTWSLKMNKTRSSISYLLNSTPMDHLLHLSLTTLFSFFSLFSSSSSWSSLSSSHHYYLLTWLVSKNGKGNMFWHFSTCVENKHSSRRDVMWYAMFSVSLCTVYNKQFLNTHI